MDGPVIGFLNKGERSKPSLSRDPLSSVTGPKLTVLSGESLNGSNLTRHPSRHYRKR
jgi:hypothetical protein